MNGEGSRSLGVVRSFCRAVVTLSRMIRCAPCFRVPRLPGVPVSPRPHVLSLPTYLLFLRTCLPTWDVVCVSVCHPRCLIACRVPLYSVVLSSS